MSKPAATAAPVPADQADVASLDDQRAELGVLLGLDGPVPETVLRRAVADQRFAYYLLSFRGRPDMLDRFFRAPATLQYARPQHTVATQRGGELVKNATGSLARWARSGFVRSEPEVYERRLLACLGCDQLSSPPPGLLSRIAAPGPQDRAGGRVCGACGCPVTRKAGLATESCPLPHPGDPARTRWDEPREA